MSEALGLTFLGRDAAGGLPGLRRWCARHGLGPVRLLASPQALAVLVPGDRPPAPLEPVAVEPRRLEAPLARLARGADLLVIDGAMWGRRLFSHLTAEPFAPPAGGVEGSLRGGLVSAPEAWEPEMKGENTIGA